MRALDQLEREKKRRQARQRPPEAGDEMEEELDLPRFVPLNRAKSLFDSGPQHTFGGINTALSVFDRQAAIRTED